MKLFYSYNIKHRAYVKPIRHLLYLVVIIIIGIATIIGSNYDGEGTGDELTEHYGASGTFTYEDDVLTLNIQQTSVPSSMGYQVGVEVYTVKSVDNSSMILIDKDDQEIIWSLGDCVPRGTVIGWWVRRDGNKRYEMILGEPNEQAYVTHKLRILCCNGC